VEEKEYQGEWANPTCLPYSLNLDHLRQVFQRLTDYGVCLNAPKCVLGASEVPFLGYTINASGIHPPDSRVEAVRAYPRPQTMRDLRRYLGMINFFRRMLPRAAESLAPLNALLAGPNAKETRPVPWNDTAVSAFERCKELLSTATLLAHPDPNAQLALFTDASGFSMGASLQQLVDNVGYPLAFFSKSFSNAQKSYSTYDRELLAVYEAIKYFRHLLQARPFVIHTDQRPLTFAFKQKPERCSP